MKTKMKLDALKVNSFMTSVEDTKANTVKGGSTPFVAVSVVNLGLGLAVYSLAQDGKCF